MTDLPGAATWTFTVLALGLVLGTCWLVCRPLLRAGPQGETPSISRWTAIWLSTAAVAGMSLSYLKVGHWEAIEVGPHRSSEITVGALPGHMAPAQARPAPSAPLEIPDLIAHLRTAPGDVEGWKQLAQRCEQAGMLDDAVKAYQAWARLTQGDADTLAQYAVTLAMSKGQSLVGEPETLIVRALRLSPRHLPSLGLAAEAAFERRDDKAALGYLQRLQAALPADSPQQASVQQRIAALAARTAQ